MITDKGFAILLACLHNRFMHPEIESLVEAGRLSREVGARLSELAPGKFCLHKNWGAGKVLSWVLEKGEIVIDFEQNPKQQMGLKFAIQKTEPIAEEDFKAQKLVQLPELKKLAKEDPAELVKRVLVSLDGTAKMDQIEKEIIGSIVVEEDYKKWWDGAKKILRAKRIAVVPAKRTEPVVLRDENLTAAQSLVMDFEAAKNLKLKAQALDAIIKDFEQVKGNAEVQTKLLADIDEAVKKGMRQNLASCLELLVGRDELIAASGVLELEDGATRLSDVIVKEGAKVGEELSAIPAVKQRAVFDAYPAAFGEDQYVKELLDIFDTVGPRGLAEIVKLLIENGREDELYSFLRTRITGRTLGAESLLWICRERKKSAAPIFDHEVGNAILSLLERDSMDDGPRKSSRLQSYFMEDKELIADLLEKATANDARSFGRKLNSGQIFPDLDRKSLMARVVKVAPDTLELVAGDAEEKKSDQLVSSWESIERRKAELEKLNSEEIPQNREDIKIAKSYGDLRENAEYHMAKDHQKVLMRRKSELERALLNVQGTDFKNVDTSTVKIGTIVTLLSHGEEIVYTILGAWDSEPDKNVISYQSEIANRLLGSVVGDEIEITQKTMSIKAIDSYV